MNILLIIAVSILLIKMLTSINRKDATFLILHQK